MARCTKEWHGPVSSNDKTDVIHYCNKERGHTDTHICQGFVICGQTHGTDSDPKNKGRIG